MHIPQKSRMPPLLPCLLGVVAGAGIGLVQPWPIARYAYALSAGLLLIALAAALMTSLTYAFRRSGSPPDPRLETTAIIDSGPFRYSRNPVYVAFALLQIALGFVMNNAWIIFLAIPAVLAMQQIVIVREEAYLEARFGDEYLCYKRRVRRWL